MKPVPAGAVAFALTFTALGFVAFAATAMLGAHHTAPVFWSAIGMMAYYRVVSAGFGGIGFVLATAPWPSWRRQSTEAAVLSAIVASLSAFLLWRTGILVYVTEVLLPVLGLRFYFYLAVPGIVAGLLAAILAGLRGRRSRGLESSP